MRAIEAIINAWSLSILIYVVLQRAIYIYRERENYLIKFDTTPTPITNLVMEFDALLTEII